MKKPQRKKQSKEQKYKIGTLVADPYDEWGVGIITEYDPNNSLKGYPESIYPYHVVFPNEEEDWWTENSTKKMVEHYNKMIED